MTAPPIYPATPDEWRRILAKADETRAPALHEASVEEFLRICCGQDGAV